MAKPILNKINTFDAQNDYTVGFTYQGIQTYRHRLLITDASDSTIVYDSTYSGFELYHTIPKGALDNDKQYFAQVQCFDKDDNASALSDGIYFSCVKTPDFYFVNLNPDANINNSSVQLDLYYAQSAGEKIKNYQFFLYDINKTNIIKSDVYYTEDFVYRFTGLEDGKQYYVRATGMTVHGLEIDTGFIKINVSYNEPEYPDKITLSCDKTKGYIAWNTNIVIINCTTPKAYDFTDGFIDLTKKEMEYNYGFLLNGDFELKLKGKNLNRTGKLLEISKDLCNLTLSSVVYDTNGNQYFHLAVENGISTYNRYSESMAITPDDAVEFVITRINNLYKLSVYKLD